MVPGRRFSTSRSARAASPRKISLPRGALRSSATERLFRLSRRKLDDSPSRKGPLARMDGAPPLSSQIAEAKAVGAAVWHRDGASLAQVHQERPGFFSAVAQMVRVPIIPGLGSTLIRREGAVLGAVGVSGGKPEQDLDCAEAGLKALAK